LSIQWFITAGISDVPFFRQGSHASSKVLENPGFFSLKFQDWKVLENHFGPGKSWKLKLKVLESPEKTCF